MSAVEVAGRRVEVESIAGDPVLAPIVLLHEGLGSIALWRDFPERLAARTGRRVVTPSRYGHGGSERLAEPRTPAYMHDEALLALPALLDTLAIPRAVLFGHSDGASIALIFAAAHPERVAALVLEAPHVFVEDITVASIAEAKERATSGDLIARLARYHDDAAATFWGWNDIWLDPAFRNWDITASLGAIHAPLLVVQARDDEYGTPEQLTAIVERLPAAQTLLLDDGGHSPHRAHPEAVLARAQAFLAPLP